MVIQLYTGFMILCVFFPCAVQIYCLFNDDVGPCVSVTLLANECSFNMTLLKNSLFYTIYKAY